MANSEYRRVGVPPKMVFLRSCFAWPGEVASAVGFMGVLFVPDISGATGDDVLRWICLLLGMCQLSAINDGRPRARNLVASVAVWVSCVLIVIYAQTGFHGVTVLGAVLIVENVLAVMRRRLGLVDCSRAWDCERRTESHHG